MNNNLILYNTPILYYSILTGSPSYGEAGYIRVYRAEDESEVCGIQLDPQDNDACEGDHKPRKVCGTCGILSGSSYLRGVHLAL